MSRLFYYCILDMYLFCGIFHFCTNNDIAFIADAIIIIGCFICLEINALRGNDNEHS